MNNSQIPAPSHLSPRSQELWAAFVPRRVRSAGRRVLLEQALSALDRADQARDAVNAQGLTTATKTTGAIHINPAAKLERESRQQFARIMADMHLGWDEREDGVNLDVWLSRQQKEAQAK